MRRLAFALMLCLPAVSLAEPAVPPQIAALLDGSKDQVVAKVLIPSPEQKVGEVRLIRRGDTDVVETLLYTALLRRVIGEIRKKENTNWPEAKEGHADAVRYLEALDAAREDMWDRMPKSQRQSDTRQKLLIEFILNDGVAAIVLSEFQMRSEGGDVVITGRRTIRAWEASRAYVERNMRLIAADSFHRNGAELENLLAPLSHLRSPGQATKGFSYQFALQ